MAKGAQVDIFGVGVAEGKKSLNVTAASRTNVYYDMQPAPGDKSRIAVFGTPGLQYACTLPDLVDVPATGLHATPSGRVFTINSETLYEVKTTSFPYTTSTEGTITTPFPSLPPTRVEFASNQTEMMVACTASGLYMYNLIAGGLTQAYFTESPLQPIEATSVTFHDGYFIISVSGSPNFYISGLYNGLSWSELEYGVPEFSGDGLLRVISKNGLLYLFGYQTYEVWQNVGDLNFPFQRVNGATKEFGLLSFDSLVQVSESIIGLFVNRQNDLAFMRIAGYEAQNITPPDLAYKLKHCDDPAACTALTFSVPGHDFYVASFGGETWAYDILTGLWTKLESGELGRHLGAKSAITPWTTSSGIKGTTLVSSYQDAQLFVFDDETYADNGQTNYRELVGSHIFLPDRGTFRVNSISLDVENGSAPLDTPMTVRLSLSRNGGHSFEEEYSDTSAIGEYTRFFQFNRLGRGRDIVPKIRMTDPCKFVLIGAVADIAPYGW